MTAPQTQQPSWTTGPDPLLGVTLGDRYTIRKLIGRGGMGLVYLATQEREPREVVVKVLAPHWLNHAEAQKRFDREARSLRSLRHANIVEMYDFGRQDDRGYLVMEFLDGVSLSKFLSQRGRLRIKEFVPIAAQILKGTGFAHSREVVVRDIKPANVMLLERKGRANFVKMLDFGLAKLVNDDNPITTESTIGTIGYIAPETISGKEPDLRVDVYALGVLFYYMLSGRLPVQADSGNSAALLYKTVNDIPPALAEVLPAGHDIPEGLLKLVHRCLEKDPAARPADANQLVEQMIDVVPASMFRLPSAVPRFEEPSDDVVGNTGLHELIEEALDRPADPPSTRWDTPEFAAGEAPDTSPVTLEVYNRGRWTALTAGLVVGALAVGAGVVFAMSNTSSAPGAPASEGQVAAAAITPPAITPPSANPREPGAALEPTTANKDPESQVPEAAGETQAADTATPDSPVALGVVVVTSEPSHASVLLDGKVVGVTPYDGKASTGTHTLEVQARGFHSWSTQVQVGVEAGNPFSVELVRKASRRSYRKSAGRGRAAVAPDPEVKLAPIVQAKPEPAIEPEPKVEPKANNPLMSGDKSKPNTGLLRAAESGGGGSVLLKGRDAK